MKKDKATKVIESAVRKGRKTLSEYESKQVLAAYEIPITKEVLIKDRDQLEKTRPEDRFSAGDERLLRGNSPQNRKRADPCRHPHHHRSKKAFRQIIDGMEGAEGGVLMQQMISGRRELVMGLTRDPQFGPCVMFGLGGIFTEILRDVSFRLAPLAVNDAREMMQEIKGRKILEAVRGMAAADTGLLEQMLINLGQLGLDYPEIKEVDLNPVILSGAKPVVVDALIIL